MSIILTDIDHVILVHADSFQKWLTTEKNMDLSNSDWRNYHRFEDWLGNIEYAEQLIKEFNTSVEFENILPGYDSLEVLPRLRQKYNFIGITACGSDPVTVELRKRNIEKYFPVIFSDIFCVDRCQDKQPFLEKYENAIWVEDSYNNAIMGRNAGHKTFLVDHLHNRNKNDYKDIIVVDNWLDIEQNIP